MTPTTLAAGAVATLALGAGVALGATGVVDVLPDEAAGPLAADLVGYHLCPEDVELGTFVRGDRVLVVGRDEAGDWLQVRSPVDLFERVWVDAAHLVPDGDTVDAPVVTCDASELVALGPQTAETELASPSPSATPSPSPTPSPSATPSVTPSPTTAPEPSPTPTRTPTPDPTTPAPSPSPSPSPSPQPSPSPSPTPSPTPPPNQPPSMSELARSNATIWVGNSTTTVCPSGSRPGSSDVSVTITDDRGVASVRMIVSDGQQSGEVGMQQSGSTWTGRVGPYPSWGSETVFVDVVATDTDGATTTRSTTIAVQQCPP